MRSAAFLKDWFLCTSLSFALFLTGLIMPLLSFPFMLLYAFPILFMTYERGAIAAIACVVTVSTALWVAFGPPFALIYVVSFGLAGILLGICARREKTGAELLMQGVVLSLCCKLATVLIVYLLTGQNFLAPDVAEIEKILAAFGGRIAGISGDGTAALDIKSMLDYMILLIPYSMILFATTEVFVCYYLAVRAHLRRIRGEPAARPFFVLPLFESWAFPKNLLVALLVGFICDILAARDAELHFVAQIGVNLGAVTRTMFIVQGLAVCYFFLKTAKTPRFLRVVVVVLTPLFTLAGDIFSIVGIIDIGFNLRERYTKSRGARP